MQYPFFAHTSVEFIDMFVDLYLAFCMYYTVTALIAVTLYRGGYCLVVIYRWHWPSRA